MRYTSKFWVRRRGELENFIMAPALAWVASAVFVLAAGLFLRPAGAQPIAAGYRDFNYGSTVTEAPTAEKPESKLWWNGGHWWGSLWDPGTEKYRIHRFDVATQSWINVGPDLDDRPKSLADALWDGEHLYVASHVYAGDSQEPGNTTEANSARLYRYSYDAATDAYGLDAGFPVLINSAKSETLVLDKDSTGRLWITWTQGNKVYMNRSLVDDLTWGEPFTLPVQGADLDGDDISTLIACNGGIGVMWSNQIDLKVYFAIHLDGKLDTEWEPREVALVDTSLGAVADDHLNIKLMSGDGALYAVTKTSLSGSTTPRIFLLKRNLNGVWTRHIVAKSSDNYTRPIVMLDEENLDLYVFASRNGAIRRKKVSLDNINFPTGAGDAFIESATDSDINNPTAAKHHVNSATGLLVLASDDDSHNYFHNYIALASTGKPTITAFTPVAGPMGAQVTINGNNFSGAVSVAFNGVAATSFTVNSNTQMSALVPAGFTTGKIKVTNSIGAGYSLTNFTAIGVRHEETQTGGSSSSTTVATSAALTGAGNHLYLAAIASKGNTAVSSVSGLGLNWTRVKAQCAGRNNTGVEVWMAQGTPGGNDVVTATLAAAPSNAVIAVSRYSGVDPASPIGNLVSGNTNGADGACSGGADNNAYAFNLTTTVDGAMVYGAAAMRDKTHTPGAGYAERVEIAQGSSNGSKAALAVQDKKFASVITATVDGTFSGSVDWAVVGLEIKPQLAGSTQYTLTVNAVGSGSVALNPAGGVYDAGTVVTLTATPGAGYQFNGWSGEVSGAANPATIAMDGNKNVTATFTASAVTVHEESQTGGSASSTTVTTSANLTGVSGHLYLAAISTQPRVGVASVSGLGLNWTLVKKQCAALNSTDVEVWMAQGTPSGNSVVTATLASAPGAAVIAVSRYSGVVPPGGTNPLGNVISGNTNGMNASATCAGGVVGDAYSFNFTTTANNAVVYSAAAMKARTHTPGASYMERAEIKQVGGSLTSSVAVEDKTVATAGTVIVNGSFNGTADWAEVALEIKPQTAGPGQYTLTTNVIGSGSVALNPSGGVYDAGTVVTLTATPSVGYQFSGWSGEVSGAANPATIAMDGNKNVTATFMASAAIVHEESQTGGSSGSTTVTTSASLTGVSGHLYLAAISTQPRVGVAAVSGLGLNWTLVKKQCAALNSTDVEVWMAQGAPSGNAAVTATLTSAPGAAVIAVSRYSGVVPPGGTNPLGNVISGNTNGLNASATCTGGIAGDSYSFNLTTTANNAVVYSAAAMKARTHTPGASYTERAEIKQVGGSLTSSVAVEDKTVATAGTVVVNGSFNGTADWAEVALEIKPPGASKAGLIATGESTTDAPPISGYQLEQNYPNPFSPLGRGTFGNPSTSIRYSLQQAGHVRLTIYDLHGQTISMPVDVFLSAGTYTLNWHAVDVQGRSLPSGVYFYRLEAGSNVVTRRMTLLR